MQQKLPNKRESATNKDEIESRIRLKDKHEKKEKTILLSNTKLTKYIIQLVIGGDFTCDLAEVMQCTSNI